MHGCVFSGLRNEKTGTVHSMVHTTALSLLCCTTKRNLKNSLKFFENEHVDRGDLANVVCLNFEKVFARVSHHGLLSRSWNKLSGFLHW